MRNKPASDLPIQGRLRIRKDRFERDVQFLREQLVLTSEPVLKSYPGYAFLQFWYVDFATTTEQWEAIKPELEQRDIFVTLFESPALIGGEAPSKPEAIERVQIKSRWRWVPLAGFGLCALSLIGAFLFADNAAAFFCVAGLGFVMGIISAAIVAIAEY